MMSNAALQYTIEKKLIPAIKELTDELKKVNKQEVSGITETSKAMMELLKKDAKGVI